MSRILVLGGYGGFGGRVAKRLALAGHDVLVAGRSIEKARTFCAGVPGLQPAFLNREDIAPGLAEHRPAIVVDASGPFQAMDYAVPAACIEAGVHYLDIADGRDFVCGIDALDAAAKEANAVVLSGASSVPALSGAVVRSLAKGLDRVRAIDMAISASNKATAGPAVATAILGQVGQPMAIWRGQRWTQAFGWQEIQSLRFECAGTAPIDHRLMGLVDVPDLTLLPERLPGQPAITFRAGTELQFQTLALALASWLVRILTITSLAPWGRWLLPAQSLTRSWGSDRSAMMVRLFGDRKGERVERRWTLIANHGDGPEIPALSIVPIVARILAGEETPGARDAGQCLELTDYADAFRTLAINLETTEEVASPSLYRRMMGERFATLAPEVAAMHDVFRDGGATGEAVVAGASNWIGGLIARIVGFPPAGRHPLHVHFQEGDGSEEWTRDFGGRKFRSRLSQHGAWLIERFGPIRFAFDLLAANGGLTMVMQRWWIGPIPLPKALAPRSTAREWAESGRFHFDVPIELPFVGRLVHYRGWLKIEGRGVATRP